MKKTKMCDDYDVKQKKSLIHVDFACIESQAGFTYSQPRDLA